MRQVLIVMGLILTAGCASNNPGADGLDLRAPDETLARPCRHPSQVIRAGAGSAADDEVRLRALGFELIDCGERHAALVELALANAGVVGAR